MQRGHSEEAFTIIEILIVIAILAILVGVSVPPMLKARKTGQESAAVQVLRSLRGAETGYKTNKHHYADLSDLAGDGACTIGEAGPEKSSGYTFTSVAGDDDYTIVAIPPLSDMSTYTLNESGILNFQ